MPIDPKWLPSESEVQDKTKAKAAKLARFAGMSMSDLDMLPPLTWLVAGIIPQGQLFEIYGPPKAGKTFLAIDMGLCVATGIDFHGKPTKQGRVLHIVGEGNRAAVRDRVKAWIEANATDKASKRALADAVEANWRLVGIPVHIDLPETRAAFLKANPGHWDLIAVDTLMRNMAGHISDPKDMAAFVAACDDIRERTGAAVLVIHHEGKDKTKGGMGSMNLDAAIDGLGKFVHEGNKRVFRIIFMRDAADDAPDMVFELVRVVLQPSFDPDVADVVSAVLRFTGAKAKDSDMTAREKLLLAIYRMDNPTSADLAATLGVGKTAVSNAAADLREIGYLGAKGWTLTPAGIEAAEALINKG